MPVDNAAQTGSTKIELKMKNQPLLFKQTCDQYLVDEEHLKHHHADETQGADHPQKQVSRRVYGKENDKKHRPYDAPFVEALQQVKVGVGQCRTFHHIGFVGKDNCF